MTSRIKLALGIVAAMLVASLAAYRLFFRSQQVVVTSAANAAVATSIHGPGTVQPRFPIVVSARLTAVVTGLTVDEGDHVRRGQLLALLDDRDLTARLTAARTELAFARANHTRDAEVFAKGYISQAAMDAATAVLHGAEAREKETAVALSHAHRCPRRRHNYSTPSRARAHCRSGDCAVPYRGPAHAVGRNARG